MKLQSKFILYFLLICIPVLFIAGIIAFNLISEVVDENLREEMWNDKIRAERLIDNLIEPGNFYLSVDSLSGVTIETGTESGYQYQIAVKMDPYAGEQLEYRVLKSYYKSPTGNYLIKIMKPALEKDDLIENLITIMLMIFGLLLVVMIVVNFIISKSLWKPFEKTLLELANFNIASGQLPKLPGTNTSEFKKLNTALDTMTKKLSHDFRLQKEFTENASHEIQTPLAIIKLNVEQLMQSEKLTESELKHLQMIENSVNKLSALNKSLLLLAKIENRQYTEITQIEIEAGVKNTLNNFESFILTKNIKVTVEGNNSAKIGMNSSLFEILLSNLIGNAIRHNIDGGKIDIVIQPGMIKISNSGTAGTLNTDKLFERFAKGEASASSTGLGLAIVKSILDTYGYTIKYSFTNDLHTFQIKF